VHRATIERKQEGKILNVHNLRKMNVDEITKQKSVRSLKVAISAAAATWLNSKHAIAIAAASAHGLHRTVVENDDLVRVR
jgi:hypothetical protein